MIRTLYTLLILLTLLPLGAQSQEDLCIGNVFSYQSTLLQEEIHYQIALPESYQTDSTMHYPLIYLLDGDSYFEVVQSVVKLYSKGKRALLPPSIVVGITSNHRTRDFTPIASAYDRNGTLSPHATAVGGEADRFTSFLTEEFIPAIEQQYRTQPERTLIGHSLAGLYALQLYLQPSHLFNRYCILDPSVWWHQGWILQQTTNSLSQVGSHKQRLYIGIAGSDPNKRTTIHQIKASALLKRLEEQIDKPLFRGELFQEETHGSIFLPGLYEGIKSLYKGLAD
ncbi:MAG: alpha/beta hydrolase [Phocaeicola sp.]